MNYLFVLCFTLLVAASAYMHISISSPSPQNPITLSHLQTAIHDVVDASIPATVSITISRDVTLFRVRGRWRFLQPIGTQEQKVGGGSGFFIRKDGLILTNKHVVSDPEARYTVVTSDGATYEAEVLALDSSNDLAIIRVIPTQGLSLPEFPVLTAVADAWSMRLGSFIIAIWNALAEYENTVTFGVISGLERSIEVSDESLFGLIQTDAAINPGNSWGPLLDLTWRVIGINTAVAANAANLGFALPIDQKEINFLLTSLDRYSTIRRPSLGVSYAMLTPMIARELNISSHTGAYILENGVLPDSPAQRTGIVPGDTITHIDGIPLSLEYPLRAALRGRFEWDVITVSIVHADGTADTLSLTL